MKLPILGGTLALACALAACGGNSDDGPPAPVASTASAPAYRITISKTEPVTGTYGDRKSVV